MIDHTMGDQFNFPLIRLNKFVTLDKNISQKQTIIVIMMMMIKTPTDLCKIKNACDLCRLNIMIYTLFILIYVQPNVRFSEFIELAWHSYIPFFFFRLDLNRSICNLKKN